MKRLLLIILLAALSSPVLLSAQEGLIIREIIVVGNTRTSEAVVRSQLPFREGDPWQDEFSQWAVHRLVTLDIFAYEPMRITVEPVSDHECRVMVRLGDPSIWYRDPAEFAAMTAMRLFSSQFMGTVYNPFGFGLNLNVNLVWGHNYSYGASVTAPLGPGAASLGGRYYRGDHTFTNTSYESMGWSAELGFWYWWNRYLRQSARIQYHDYELDGTQGSRIIPGTGLLYHDSFTALGTAAAGISLQDDPLFWRVQGALSKEFGPAVALARGGYTSPDTPGHMQFAVGRYSLLPLRGEDMQHLARAYALGTAEYHFSLGMLAPIVFADGGWVWNGSPGQDLNSILINLGAGLAFYTPIGIPVRVDFAMNPVTASWGWNIGFGHSYIPLF